VGLFWHTFLMQMYTFSANWFFRLSGQMQTFAARARITFKYKGGNVLTSKVSMFKHTTNRCGNCCV